MPYKLSWEPQGITFRFSGVVSDRDLTASNEEVYASPLLATMKYQIVDFSVIEKFDVSSETVREVAASDQRAAETNPDVKAAIITSAPFLRGMANIYAHEHEAKGGSWTTQLFEREEDARAWAVPSN